MAEAKLKFSLEVDDKGSVKLKQFGKEVDAVALKGGTFGAKMQAAASGVASLAVGAAKAAAALGTVAAAMAIGIGGKALAAFAEYEESVARLSVVTSESLESIRSKIAQIGPEFGSQTELIKGYYDVLSAGAGQYGDEIEFLKTASMMAKQAHIEQGEAVKGLATVMAAYGKELGSVTAAANLLYNVEASGLVTVKEMIPYMGEISNLSKAAGLSFAEMAAGYAQMSKEGAGASAALTKFKAVIMSIQGSFDKLPESIQRFGSATAAIKALGFEGVLREIANATNLNVGALTKMLGTQEAALGVLQLAKGGWKEYGAALETVKDKTDTFTRAWENFKETLNGVWSTFRNVIGNFLVSIGEQLAPAVKELVRVFGAWMEAIKPAVIEWLKTALEGLPDRIKAFWTEAERAGGVWNLFVGYMEKSFPTITKIGQGMAWLVEQVSWAIEKMTAFSRWFEEQGDATFVAEFIGHGSSAAPLGEKIAEMVDKLEVMARVANFHATGTVSFVGEGGQPLSEAIETYGNKIEKLAYRTVDVAKASKSAGDEMEYMTKKIEPLKPIAAGATEAIGEMGGSVREASERFFEAGYSMAYSMQSVRNEVSETGIALNKHAADMRQLRDEYMLWSESARRTAEGMKLANIYWDAARSAASAYRDELAKLERQERSRALWGGYDNALEWRRSTMGGNKSKKTTGGYQTGTGLRGIPYTGLFRLHQGEIVLNPDESRLMRSVAKTTRSHGSGGAAPSASAPSSGGGGSSITVNINPGVMIGDRSGIKAVIPYLKEELDTYLRRTKLGWQA